MAENRLARELQTREKTERPKSWAPPQVLPDPTPEPGYAYRWIRISTMNQADPTNISGKLREGWEPVRASDHPELMYQADQQEGRFKDNVVIGGLMLCKTPTELVDQRNAYYQQQTENQISSVDNNFMRENDPRMPLFSEKRSKVTFGGKS